MLKRKKYTTFNKKLAISLIFSGLAATPVLLLNSTSTFMTCIAHAILSEIWINIDPDNVVASYLNKDAMIHTIDDDKSKVLAIM